MNHPAPFQSIAAIGADVGDLVARHFDHLLRVMLRGPKVVIDPGFVRLITGEPHPFGNFAMFCDVADPATVEAAIAPLIQCGMPSAVLFCSPIPALVSIRLSSAGYEPHDPMPAMVVEIEKLPATTLPPGYTFARFGADAEADRWAEVFADGYEIPRGVGAQFKPVSSSADDSGDPPMQSFAIFKNGTPVCTSLVYFNAGVAGIYCVATLPAERGKGLATHVTAEPLRRAYELGYRVGALQSSPAGHSIYRRLGFEDVGEVSLLLRTSV